MAFACTPEALKRRNHLTFRQSRWLVEHEVAEAVEYPGRELMYSMGCDVWMVSYDGIRPGISLWA